MLRTKHKTGRNEPCPCGSGLKSKHCHSDPSKQEICNRVAFFLKSFYSIRLKTSEAENKKTIGWYKAQAQETTDLKRMTFPLWKNDGESCDEYFPSKVMRKIKALQAECQAANEAAMEFKVENEALKAELEQLKAEMDKLKTTCGECGSTNLEVVVAPCEGYYSEEADGILIPMWKCKECGFRFLNWLMEEIATKLIEQDLKGNE